MDPTTPGAPTTPGRTQTTPAVHDRDGERQRLEAALPAYEIGAVLGRGAFAVVYAGRHRRLEREVAIKRLSPDLLREGEARDRFAAEARLLASLDHPHIVRVHDFVEEEEVCAFVMERMHGGTLGDRMAVGRLSPARACAVILGALHGLEHAHRQGVLHRDIKPENLLFGENDLVKVADFGIAKVVGAQGARLTATAAGIGTPAYMAPEQVTRSAGRLSSATDVWATGAVLYELLAGERPFPAGGELGEVLVQRVISDPRPLLEVAPGVPQDLADVVMKALRRDSAERYPTPGAFAAALEPAAERAAGAGGLAATGIPLHRTPPRRDESEQAMLVESSDVELLTLVPEVARARRRRRRGALMLAAGAVVAAIAVAVVVALSGGGTGARALPPAPPGWPRTMSFGFVDQVEGSAGAARRLGRGGMAPEAYGGDAAARKDWSHDPHQEPPARFVRRARSAGLFPRLYFYQLRALGQSGRGDDAEAVGLRQILTDPRLMGIYWRNVRRFLREIGSTRQPAAISLDSNFWSYLQQHLAPRGQRPSTVRARVGLSGLPELRGIADNLQGIAKGWRALRDRYAPKVVLGYAFDDWAAAITDISRDGPPLPTVVDSARQAAEFFLDVAANDLDFAELHINGDLAEEGQNPGPKYVYSRAEKEAVVAYAREFVRVAGIRVALAAVPLGNTVRKAITDKPFHWRDSWVQWLMGADRFDGLRKLRDAGVIGVAFGVNYGENETCPCDAAGDGVTNDGRYPEPSTSADDDGGYFADRMAALRQAGGLPLG